MRLDRECKIPSKTQKIILFGYFICWIFILPLIITLVLQIVQLNDASILLFIQYLLGTLIFGYLGRSILYLELKVNWKKLSRSILVGIGLLFFINFVFYLIYTELLGIVNSENQRALLEIKNESPLLTFISVAIFAPIVEEIVFRGVIFRKQREHKSFLTAALISGLVFGFIHVLAFLLSGNLIDFLYIFLYGALGVVFSKVYEDTGSIYSCIILHGVYNTLAFVLSSM